MFPILSDFCNVHLNILYLHLGHQTGLSFTTEIVCASLLLLLYWAFQVYLILHYAITWIRTDQLELSWVCFVVLSVGRPLWREDGFVTYSAIADWSGHWGPITILCSLYDSQGLRWRYSNPPPHGVSGQRVYMPKYITSVHTSQETHYVSTTKTNRLVLFRETVTVYCENHTEHTDTFRTSQEAHYVSAHIV
jgi:hypothetical protein